MNNQVTLLEPITKKAIVFIDGQNLFHAAKEAFGYPFPNYDAKMLAEEICSLKGWSLNEIRFYTGIPDVQDDVLWHTFWINKLTYMGQVGVKIFSRSLRYRNQTIRLPDGKMHTFLVGQEKGIDIRIALDIIRLAHAKVYDVGVIFSQDQDLSEVADEVRIISAEQHRWLKLVSAFPVSPAYKNNRGINKTDWIRIDRKIYDFCLDSRDYRKTS